RLYLKGDGLAGQSLDEDLHRTSRLGEAHAHDERNQKGEYSWQVTPPPTLPEMRRKGALLSQLIARVTPAPVRASPKAGQGAQRDKAIHGASGGNRTRTTEVERF